MDPGYLEVLRAQQYRDGTLKKRMVREHMMHNPYHKEHGLKVIAKKKNNEKKTHGSCTGGCK